MDKQELRKIDVQIAEQLFGLKVVSDWPCKRDFRTNTLIASVHCRADRKYKYLEEYTERDYVYVPKERGVWPPVPFGEDSLLDFAVVEPVPFYTQDWYLALAVKDELEKLGYKIHFRYDGDRDAKWARWTFFCKEVGRVDDYEGPLTICRGALAIMECRLKQRESAQ